MFLFYIKSLGGVYNTQTKLNPGAALEEPEQQCIIRSINAQAPTTVPWLSGDPKMMAPGAFTSKLRRCQEKFSLRFI